MARKKQEYSGNLSIDQVVPKHERNTQEAIDLEQQDTPDAPDPSHDVSPEDTTRPAPEPRPPDPAYALDDPGPEEFGEEVDPLQYLHCPICLHERDEINGLWKNEDGEHVTCPEHEQLLIAQLLQEYADSITAWDPHGELSGDIAQPPETADAAPTADVVLGDDLEVAPEPVTKELPVEHTTADREAILDEMSGWIEQRRIFLNRQAELRAEATALNKNIEQADEALDDLQRRKERGTDDRPVACEMHYDWEQGEKYLVRADTGEVVGMEPITETERQQGIFDQPTEDTTNAAEDPIDGQGTAGAATHPDDTEPGAADAVSMDSDTGAPDPTAGDHLEP